MTTSTSTTTTPSAIPSASPAAFDPFDFLQRFVGDISSGVVFRTANGSSILSSIEEGSIVTPTQVREAFDIIAGYFKSPGLSSDMDLNRVQQFAVFLAEIVKHQHHHNGDSARFTAYELGNAVTALQAVLKPRQPTGKN